MALDLSKEYSGLFQMKSFDGREVREGTYMLTFKMHGQICEICLPIGSMLIFS
jgi:hypothetical protein